MIPCAEPQRIDSPPLADEEIGDRGARGVDAIVSEGQLELTEDHDHAVLQFGCQGHLDRSSHTMDREIASSGDRDLLASCRNPAEPHG